MQGRQSEVSKEENLHCGLAIHHWLSFPPTRTSTSLKIYFAWGGWKGAALLATPATSTGALYSRSGRGSSAHIKDKLVEVVLSVKTALFTRCMQGNMCMQHQLRSGNLAPCNSL